MLAFHNLEYLRKSASVSKATSWIVSGRPWAAFISNSEDPTMDIDVTAFIARAADLSDSSASQAERGINAGLETWNNALALAEALAAPLLRTVREIAAFKRYVRDFGAWEPEEINGWYAYHCNALLIQLIAGDMRDAGLDSESTAEDWQAYEAREDVSHNLYRAANGRIYYSLQH